MAKFAEKLGFESLWVSDHLFIPRPLADEYSNYLEPINTLSFVAAVTERVKLGTSVLVLPLRNPIVVAREAVTIDHLSNGRLILGVGAGWLEDEFRAVNIPISERGRILEEQVNVLRSLWIEDQPDFEGRYTRLKNIAFEPKPVQTEGPPIWIGGNSEAAIRKAARIGDGWHPVALSPSDMARGITAVKGSKITSGRFVFSLRRIVEIKEPQSKEEPNEVGTLVGTLREIRRVLEEYQRIGVQHFICYFDNENMDKLLFTLNRFGEEYIESFG
ncbi:MAG: LLM class F420-dependent oxidoreductase [Candidatus Bathyarchaeia archaeon]